jgi:hypothetical protein
MPKVNLLSFADMQSQLRTVFAASVAFYRLQTDG